MRGDLERGKGYNCANKQHGKACNLYAIGIKGRYANNSA